MPNQAYPLSIRPSENLGSYGTGSGFQTAFLHPFKSIQYNILKNLNNLTKGVKSNI